MVPHDITANIGKPKVGYYCKSLLWTWNDTTIYFHDPRFGFPTELSIGAANDLAGYMSSVEAIKGNQLAYHDAVPVITVGEPLDKVKTQLTGRWKQLPSDPGTKCYFAILPLSHKQEGVQLTFKNNELIWLLLRNT